LVGRTTGLTLSLAPVHCNMRFYNPGNSNRLNCNAFT
jgi:hypothetical protein